MTTRIHEASPSELQDLLRIHQAAFDAEEEAELVQSLLSDPTAQPTLSLVARNRDMGDVQGHILFTRASLEPDRGLSAALLAPLAVLPNCQGQGVGGRLVETGHRLLAQRGVELVFVLGHPAYYPRHGYLPAGVRGFEAPYPIAPQHADAWMVHELQAGAMDSNHGTVRCAAAIDEPRFWVE